MEPYRNLIYSRAYHPMLLAQQKAAREQEAKGKKPQSEVKIREKAKAAGQKAVAVWQEQQANEQAEAAGGDDYGTDPPTDYYEEDFDIKATAEAACNEVETVIKMQTSFFTKSSVQAVLYKVVGTQAVFYRTGGFVKICFGCNVF